LAARLSGLHDAKDIAIELWQYKRQHESQRAGGAADSTADVVTSALRRSGVPEEVVRMAAQSVADPQGGSYSPPGMPNAPGLNPYAGIPELQGLSAQGFFPNGNGRPLTGRDAWKESIRQQNEQMTAMAEQYLIPQEAAMKPAVALPYQVVPASVAARNPAVANPLPFGVMDSPSSALTLFPNSP